MTKALRIRATAKDVIFMCPSCKEEKHQPTWRFDDPYNELLMRCHFQCHCAHRIDFDFDEAMERVAESKRLAREAHIRDQNKPAPGK